MPWVTLEKLAEWTGGELLGDGEVRVNNALPLQDASANCITLVDHAKHVKRFESSPAAAALATAPLASNKPVLLVGDLHGAFTRIIHYLRPAPATNLQGVSIAASVDPTASIGENATIQAGSSVGALSRVGRNCIVHPNVTIMAGCSIGDDCELFPGVTLYPGTILGSRVLIHSGAVLGAYGFGYRLVDGKHQRTAQMGWVDVGDDVEIGACSSIDRGTYGPTRIGSGTKIDNQVQVGHNCHIGKHNLICAQVGIAGSCSTGDHVVLAGQVGIADHIHLGDRVMVGAQSGIMHDQESGALLLGSPAKPSKQTMQEVAHVSKLPALRKEVRSLQRQLQALVAAKNCDSVDAPESHNAPQSHAPRQRDAA